MAYADRNVGGSRAVAVVIVAILVALLGYAFVTGLAYDYVKKQLKELKTFEVDEPPPPPEEVPPPPPPPDQPVPPPPVYNPPPVVQTQVQQQPQIQTQSQVPVPQPAPQPIPVPVPAPQPAPPAKPAVAKPLVARNPGSWVTDADYPSAALRSGDAGTTRFKLDVDGGGKVTNCSVTGSSGSSLLDSTACNLLRRRARFTPAQDADGNKIASSYSGRFTWKIPAD